MNLQNALALNAKIEKTSKLVTKIPHFQLVVDNEKNVTNITFSDAFMKLADVQNNKLNVYYENADSCVYFIFHQGNGVQGESLAIDFFAGKKVSKKDDNGIKIDTDEIGTKTPRFKDGKTVSGDTIKELLVLQYLELKDNLKLSGTFVKNEGEFPSELKVTSVWSLNLNEGGQQLDLFNQDTIVGEVKPLVITDVNTNESVNSELLVDTVETIVTNSTEELINSFNNSAPVLNYTDSLTEALLTGEVENSYESSSAFVEYNQ